MTRLPGIQGRFHRALTGNADLLYRHAATWSDGTSCRFSVYDVSRSDSTLARILRDRADWPDLRMLKLHPADPRPAPLSRLSWEDGLLYLERYAQTSDFTGTAPGILHWVQPTRARVTVLTFTLPGAPTTDALGNPKRGAGAPLPVSVRLAATDDPAVRELSGADTSTLAITGRWGTLANPGGKPAALDWGSSARLTLDGQPGVLTLRVAYPDPDPVSEAIFGQRFAATWRAG